jgi:hypothetical protein
VAAAGDRLGIACGEEVHVLEEAQEREEIIERVAARWISARPPSCAVRACRIRRGRAGGFRRL